MKTNQLTPNEIRFILGKDCKNHKKNKLGYLVALSQDFNERMIM